MRNSIEEKVRKDFKFNIALIICGFLILFFIGMVVQDEPQPDGFQTPPLDQRSGQ